jgi:two-component system NtrC family response regulator
MANILIIDDDKMLCSALAGVIEKIGHKTFYAHTLKEGKDIISDKSIEVVILDIRLPDGDGLEALPFMRESLSSPEVIILTGAGDPDGAELAIHSGAWNYLTKPPTMSKIKLHVQRAIDYHQKKNKRRKPITLKRQNIIGESSALLASLDIVAQSASTDANTLITGETGTGKELFARAIHENSSRAQQPFIVVDCPALPEKLIESTLFGHEKGAFTSADKRSEGLIIQADKGTLFLDEVGELPLSMQKTLLRVLQDHRFRPVGGAKELSSDFRLIAATNRDLEQMVQEGTFRQDLFYRLQTIHIKLPPLRERKSDLKTLCCHFINKHCEHLGIERKGFSTEFLDSLLQYDWPGNIRELIHALENAIAIAQPDPILYYRHLPTSIRGRIARKSVQETDTQKPVLSSHVTLDTSDFPTLQEFRSQGLAEIESQYLRKLLHLTGGNMQKAISLSGLSRARVYALLKKYNISK